MIFSLFKKKKKTSLHTIAFYNLENLFDAQDNPDTLDNDFTPKGFKRWTPKRYRKKVSNLAHTIVRIGMESTERPPTLVGIAEVENAKVIEDLIETGPLKKINYGYVHYDSPDERGIDTGLLYNKDYFVVLFSEPIPLMVYNGEGVRDTTRDILYVHGKLNGEPAHVFVNHWPSRRDGDVKTEYKRLEAAKTLRRKMDEIQATYKDPNYIIMGDFNDNPDSKSIQTLLNDSGLYNPMEKLGSPYRGSANYRRSWSMFDQIIVSHNFFNFEKGTHSFAHANIFDEHTLMERKGKYKGNPYRTYVGRKYIGGYSDHFPVYVQLKYVH